MSSPNVQPFPANLTIPAGTTASADFCPIRTTLKAAPLHPATRDGALGQISPDKNIHFPLPPPHLHTGRFGGTGFTICCWLTPTGMPSMRFVSLGAGICLRLPSHPISR